MTEINTIQDIADIINKDVTIGAGQMEELFQNMDRAELEEWALKMSLMISIISDF